MQKGLKKLTVFALLSAAGFFGLGLTAPTADARPRSLESTYSDRSSAGARAQHSRKQRHGARRHAAQRRHYARHRTQERRRHARRDHAAVYRRAAGSRHMRIRQREAARDADWSTQAPAGYASYGSSGFSSIVEEAKRLVGATARQLGLPSSLWCADFMNLALKRAGQTGTGSRKASSFAGYGRRISGPQVGAIAIMSRGKRGGHVGVVSGIDASGNPIIISGNHGNRVAEAKYARSRVYAYVMPN